MVTPPLSHPYCAVGDGSAEDLCLAPQQPHLLGRVPSHVHLRHFCHGWYVSGYQCPSPAPPTPNTVCMLSAPPLPCPHQTLCACSVPLPCPTHTKHCTCSVPLPCPAHTKYCVHAQCPSPNSNRLITPDCYICSLAYVPAPPPAPTPFHPHTAFVALLSLNKLGLCECMLGPYPSHTPNMTFDLQRCCTFVVVGATFFTSCTLPPPGEAAADPCDPRCGMWGGLCHCLCPGLPAAA